MYRAIYGSGTGCWVFQKKKQFDAPKHESTCFSM